MWSILSLFAPISPLLSSKAIVYALIMIKAILFDLDGTLLPMDEKKFEKAYFSLLCSKVAPLGYEPNAILNAILKCTGDVLKNNGKATNEEVFWHNFSSIYGEKALQDKPIFDEFYKNEFNLARGSCGYNQMASLTIKRLKELGYRIIIATNPVFPAFGTKSRIKWAGLDEEDFELITTYENSRYCKPNPDYYKEILSKQKLTPDECIMVGNDAEEDMVATTLGIKGFLLTDNLINRKNYDLEKFPRGGYTELWRFLDSSLEGGFKIDG